MRRLLAVVVSFVAIAAACSGTSSRDRAIEAVTDGMIGDQQFAAASITEFEANCVGEYLVDELGADTVLEFDTDDPDFISSLNQVQIDAMGLALEACVGNIDQVVIDELARSLQAPGLARTPSARESRCVAEAVAPEISLARLIVIGRATSADQAVRNAMTDDEALVFGVAYVTCTDFRETVLDQLAEAGWGPAHMDCFDAELSDEMLAVFLAARFRNAEAPNPLAAAEEACVGPASDGEDDEADDADE